MIKKLIMSGMFIVPNIISMESNQEIKVTPMKFEKFVDLPIDVQQSIAEFHVLNSFNDIFKEIDNDINLPSLEYNVKRLFNKRAESIKINKLFKKVADNNGNKILKKFADDLLKTTCKHDYGGSKKKNKPRYTWKDFQKILFDASWYPGFIPITEDIVQMLIYAGIKIDWIDESEYSTNALMMATIKNKTDGIKILIKFGADVNFKNSEGHTALVHLLRNAHLEKSIDSEPVKYTLKILLDAKADPNCEVWDGKTALDYARGFGNQEIIQMLEDAIQKSTTDNS
ncbi:ankyrin repeat domain-containing protein [Candidatus Dependentiae bacterium]|nr:ankyrin repeat domain-containing protein [Candidatus Dependentiae bacterium]